jgi:enoyl-CoA hydratase/carnithine racemase
MVSVEGYDEDGGLFSEKRLDDIVLIQFRENFFHYATDFGASRSFLDYLDTLSQDDSIKVLVILAADNDKGCEAYLQFYSQVLEGKLGSYAVPRMCHALDQLILKLVELNQIIIYADAGNVTSMFLNLSLACDYRIIADNTVFENPCLELGLVPKGGGAFFLSRIVGQGMAYRIMLSIEDLTAHEAKALNLVDKVVPMAELEDAALDMAKELAQRPASTLRGVKRLLNYNLKELSDYLEFENRELQRIIQSPEF